MLWSLVSCRQQIKWKAKLAEVIASRTTLHFSGSSKPHSTTFHGIADNRYTLYKLNTPADRGATACARPKLKDRSRPFCGVHARSGARRRRAQQAGVGHGQVDGHDSLGFALRHNISPPRVESAHGTAYIRAKGRQVPVNGQMDGGVHVR